MHWISFLFLRLLLIIIVLPSSVYAEEEWTIDKCKTLSYDSDAIIDESLVMARQGEFNRAKDLIEEIANNCNSEAQLAKSKRQENCPSCE